MHCKPLHILTLGLNKEHAPPKLKLNASVFFFIEYNHVNSIRCEAQKLSICQGISLDSK